MDLVCEEGSSVPSQDVAIQSAMQIISVDDNPEDDSAEQQMIKESPNMVAKQDLIISLRVALGGFTLSLIDSAPSEIASSVMSCRVFLSRMDLRASFWC